MPEQVLSMSLSTFQAVVEGYQEHLFDLKCLTVYAGYWAGYYSNTKHPSGIGSILQKLFNEHRASKEAKNKNSERPEVDVEKFLQRERNFKARMQRR